MEEKKNVLSSAGLKKLEDELDELREQGDLSENAEYDAAKEEQRETEARIEEIENLLKNAEIIVDEEIDAKKISVGCTVTLQEQKNKVSVIYKVVGNIEADSLNGMISYESPLGKALIGKKKGEIVEFNAPAGTFSYKVTKIEKTV